MINIFRKNPVKIKITDLAGKPVDELLFVSSKKGGMEFFKEVATDYVILDLFPEDSIKDFKEKIFVATGIYPCEQCLLYNGNIISSDTNIDGKLTDETINGIPINKIFYQRREELNIYSLEFETIGNIFTDGFEVECRSLKTVQNWVQKDLELVYWSLVNYFPYFSESAFKEYTAGANVEKYPLLYPDRNLLLQNFRRQNEIMNNIYDFVNTAEATKYNISLVDGKNNRKSELKFMIDEMLVLVQKRGSVNLENLFTVMTTTEELPIIIYNGKTASYTKVFAGAENQIPHFLYKSNHNSIFILCSKIIFEINAEGAIYGIIYNGAADSMDFHVAEKEIELESEILFDHLDSLKLSLFKQEPILDYYDIIKISTTMVWFKGTDDFGHILKKITDSRLAVMKTDKNNNKFVWIKGAQTDTIPARNEFSFLVDNMLNLQYLNWFELENKYTEIVIRTKNMSNTDFKSFMKFLVYLLGHTETVDIKNIKKNNLKMLKILDPVTYDLGKMSGDKVYARFCQKQKQPVPVAADEMNKYDQKNLLKFWNFTKEEPMYFFCPNENYPFPGFLTGHHPNGNCLVCCKKKNIEGSKYDTIHKICMEDKYFKSKKDLSQARYVINFGKDLDPGRLGTLPSILIKFLHYNESEQNIISEAVTFNIFRYRGNIYSTERLHKITKNTKVQEVPLTLLENFLHKPVWRRKRKGEELIKPIDVIKNPEADRKIKKKYKRILQSDLSLPIYIYYDDSVKSFVVLDGIHRLTLAFIKKQTFVLAKMITDKQMKRVQIGKYSIDDTSFLPDALAIPEKTGGNSDKEPFYYIYGIPYFFENTECSFLYSAAAAFELNIDCYLDDVLHRLSKVEYVSSYAASELIQNIRNTFKTKNFVVSADWDAIFFEILPILYNFTPIVLHYGSSTDIRLTMPQVFSDWEDLNFILFIKNSGKYNPIFVTIPYVFSKNRTVEKRIYTGEDHIIKLFDIICRKQFESNNFTISKITQIPKLSITKIFTYGGIVYAVEIDGAVYCSVEQTKINDLSYEKLVIKKYGLKEAIVFLATYSEKYGVPINVHTIFVHEDRVSAYGIDEMVNFVSCSVEQAQKAWPDAAVQYWNYEAETIINAKTNKEDPLYTKYVDLVADLDNYEFFKEKFFKKKKLDKNFKPQTVYEQAVWEEMQNPIKYKLMEAGIFNFRRLFLKKQKNENIYIRLK